MSVVAAGVMAGGSIIGGIFGSSAAKREAARKEAEARRLQAKLTHLEENRQEIIDPYANITDLSSMLSNPFANLSVATQATQMQMEQTDIALANTLDTIRATGAGAGGATALAQAAAQSKAKVSAGLEQQEAANAKAAAQGEASLQIQKANIEQAAISEEIKAYGRQESRDTIQLDRMQGAIDDRRSNLEDYRGASTDAFLGGVGGLGEGLMQTDFTELGN